MEVKILAHLNPHVTRAMIAAFRRGPLLGNHATFSGLPTQVLFPPGGDFFGSVHYMFFPKGTVQKLHRHPSPRYLLGFGDVDVRVHHGEREDDGGKPVLSSAIAPAFTVSAIRFPARLWHYFEALDQEAQGAVFFSFHDRDEVDEAQAGNAGLMEELTEFWQDERGH